MEIRIGTKTILLLLNILAWIFFLGLCFNAGATLFNTIFAFYKPEGAKQFWNGADLSNLYAFNETYFITLSTLMFIVAVLKAIIFYLIVRSYYNKNLSMAKPFDPAITRLIFSISFLCIGASFFSSWGVNYATNIKSQGAQLPDVHYLSMGGADVWLFMAVVLIVIGQIFKKGIQLQTDNDLTI